MKKFLLMTTLLLASIVGAQAQKLATTSLRHAAKQTAQSPFAVKKVVDKTATATQLGRHAAPKRAPITEQPEGELVSYRRTAGSAIFSEDGYLYYQPEQSGEVSIVYAEDNVVYVKNVLYGIGDFFGESWVQGTISDDGTTLSIPVGQSIYYSSSYNADVVLCWGSTSVSDGSLILTVDETVDAFTYTIDNENNTITLNGSKSLADEADSNPNFWAEGPSCVWTDDDSFGGFLDVETVLTKSQYLAPTDVEAIDVTETTATISWTENGEATSWEVEYVAFDDDFEIIEETIVSLTTDQNPLTLTDLDPDTFYAIIVRPEGGDDYTWAEGYFQTNHFSVRPEGIEFTTTSKTATIYWVGDESCDNYTVAYRMPDQMKYSFIEDFEEGLDNWTIYTQDNAPKQEGWYTYDPTTGLSFEAHSGSYAASAWSWTNQTAYSADNWLVSPKVDLKGYLSFWVRTNKLFPDQYEVMLSTGDNAIEDFTVTLQEMATAPATGEWENVKIDLSEYEGQQGYIAIHHKDYDANYLLIDDFGIVEAEISGTDWTELVTEDEELTIDGLDPETTYEFYLKSTTNGMDSKLTQVYTFTTEPLSIETAIKTVTASEGTDTWYTLDGRKLNAKPMTKGVFIKNGQKVVNN